MFESFSGIRQSVPSAPDKGDGSGKGGSPDKKKTRDKRPRQFGGNRVERRRARVEKSKEARHQPRPEKLVPKERTAFQEAQSRLDKMRHLLASTFTREAGVYQVTFSRLREANDEAKSAQVTLNIVGVICKADVDVSALKNVFVARMEKELPAPVGIDIRTFWDFEPKNVLYVPAENENQFAGLTQLVENNDGRSLVLVDQPESGRKTQMEITGERAPLRARRLRMLQSLLEALPDIARSGSVSDKKESAQKVAAVADAIAIRGPQALYNTRSKIYSARNDAFSGPDDDDARAEARTRYDEQILAFDRALERTADALASDSSDPESAQRTAAIFSMLAEANFNLDRLGNTVSPQELADARSVVENLRAQLVEFTVSITDGEKIGRGANKIKTILGYIGAQDLSKRLIDTCLQEVKNGSRYQPDAVTNSDTDENAQFIPNPETVREVEAMMPAVHEFQRLSHAYEYDVDGLRAALRLGYWKESQPWSPRGLRSETTLVQALHVTEQEIPALRSQILEFVKTQDLIEKKNRAGAEGLAFENVFQQCASIMQNMDLLEVDVRGLQSVIDDPETMHAINTLAEINLELHMYLRSDAANDEKNSDQVKMIENLIYHMYNAVNEEEWELVRKLSVTLPIELGAH